MNYSYEIEHDLITEWTPVSGEVLVEGTGIRGDNYQATATIEGGAILDIAYVEKLESTCLDDESL